MKLSDLNTDRALDVLCELTPYAGNILEDDDFIQTIGEKLNFDENMNVYGKFAILAGKIGKITPILMKTHRADVYGVLSALNEKSVKEIEEQPIGETMRQLKECFRDIELMRFFRSFIRRAQKEPSAPSADSHDSE